MDFELTDEQCLIVETVRNFVRNELYPHEDEVERLDEVPPELATAIREKAVASGLYAANMPAELGGGGLDAVSMVLVENSAGLATRCRCWSSGRATSFRPARASSVTGTCYPRSGANGTTASR